MEIDVFLWLDKGSKIEGLLTEDEFCSYSHICDFQDVLTPLDQQMFDQPPKDLKEYKNYYSVSIQKLILKGHEVRIRRKITTIDI